MEIPDWRSFRAGGRIRVALWLRSEVGTHGVFTKSQLREAFPGVEQIDRRMRDLRPDGWVIATYQEDRSLSVEELRLVTEGAPVWEQGFRSRNPKPITSKQRRSTFLADNFMCVYCGISGGEPYPEDPVQTAKLTTAPSHSTEDGLHLYITVCNWCHVATLEEDDPSEVRLGFLNLDGVARHQVIRWIRKGCRERSPEELLWGRYRRLPGESRARLLRELSIE